MYVFVITNFVEFSTSNLTITQCNFLIIKLQQVNKLQRNMQSPSTTKVHFLKDGWKWVTSGLLSGLHYLWTIH